jgi:hypothetical protein
VGRDAATDWVEMTSEGGTMGAHKVIMKAILEADPSKKERLRTLIVQVPENAPMEMKKEAGHKEQFAPLNPRKLLGKETIKVAAGSFATRHYRDKAQDGTVVEVWVSDEAPPFGLVRLKGTMVAPVGSDAPVPVIMELVGRGNDAKPAITKPPQAFDQELLMRQMTRLLTNSAGAK